MKEVIKKQIKESIDTKETLLDEIGNIGEFCNILINAYKNNKKVLIFGNGGSAADAQHFAAELVNKFKRERKALNCIALTTDTSSLTSIGNDYGFEKIFERQVEALANKDDILIGISTSGNSENVVKALKKGKELNCKTISLLGKDGGKMKDISDLDIIIKSNETARIQECHELILHIVSDLVEEEFTK